MQSDYVYPSIYFAYFYFFILLVGAIFFFLRSLKDGYFDERSEASKYEMLNDHEFNQDGVKYEQRS